MNMLLAQELLTTTIQGISAIGFPAFMCILMIKYMQESDAKNRDELKALNETIQSNSIVITQLMERIERLNERIGDNK